MSAFIHSPAAFRRVWAAVCIHEDAAQAVAFAVHWREEQGPRSAAIWRWIRALEAAQVAAVAHRYRDVPAALELPETPPGEGENCGPGMTPAGLINALCSIEYQAMEGDIPDREPFATTLRILADVRLAVALRICRRAPGCDDGSVR